MTYSFCSFHSFRSFRFFRPVRLTNSIVISALAFVLPVMAATVPPPPTVTSKAHILIDYDSGQVLAELNPDMRLEPASLTKIMSADLVFHEIVAGRIKLTDQVLISEYAWHWWITYLC
jgi:D-alanyl-D-alanine carboxypeptidase (penicillin-binding protein 5/6)